MDATSTREAVALLSKLRSIRLSHTTVVAYLALFVALGGSSYAAITVTGKNVKNSSLTGRDIKNSSLTTSDVKNGALLARDFKAGQLPAGPQGPKGDKGDKGDKGESATKLFAHVQADGTLGYGSGAIGVSKPFTGQYDVTFNRSLENCVALVTLGFGRPVGADLAQDGSTGNASLANGPPVVHVSTVDPAGASANRGFHLAVFC